MTLSGLISAYQNGKPLSGQLEGGDPSVQLKDKVKEVADDRRVALWFCLAITGLTFVAVFIFIFIYRHDNRIVMGLLFGQMPIVYFLLNRSFEIYKTIQYSRFVIMLIDKVTSKDELSLLLDSIKLMMSK